VTFSLDKQIYGWIDLPQQPYLSAGAVKDGYEDKHSFFMDGCLFMLESLRKRYGGFECKLALRSFRENTSLVYVEVTTTRLGDGTCKSDTRVNYMDCYSVCAFLRDNDMHFSYFG
jgi:hypothetical protein